MLIAYLKYFFYIMFVLEFGGRKVEDNGVLSLDGSI